MRGEIEVLFQLSLSTSNDIKQYKFILTKSKPAGSEVISFKGKIL